MGALHRPGPLASSGLTARWKRAAIGPTLALGLIASACSADLARVETTAPAATSTDGMVPTPEPTVTPATTAVPDPTAEATAAPTDASVPDTGTWTQINAGAQWEARAGLRVLAQNETLFLLGGRTPNQSSIPGDSRIWSDVWRSEDRGASWKQILDSDLDHWEPRAYFQALDKDGELFVLGGQDYGLEPNPFCDLLEQGFEPPPGLGIDPDAPCPEFFPTSQFFNDVWRSSDGVAWEEMTSAAPWEARAGLSATVLGDHLYVLGGSQNDDASIIGENGPERLYFNDVWRSSDGADWELMTDAAPWEPRAGGALLAYDGALWLLGGEDGFTCSPLPDCDPPYFNDVWRSTDGAEWELISAAAAWSPRPGHVCKELAGRIVCFGGFGLIENPLDVWSTADGVEWDLIAGPPWNAAGSAEAKYDFDAVAVPAGPLGDAVILTFGGDRETFDFEDPDNWLRIDNDVWQLAIE